MTYYETPGVLFDTACFLVFYYNEEYMQKRAMLRKVSFHEVFSYYQQLKPVAGSLPERLQLFSFKNEKTPALITNIVYQREFATMTYQGFVDYLRSDEFKWMLITTGST